MRQYFTPAIVLDAEHLEQEFRFSIRTWQKYKPLLWEMPWVVLFDRSSLKERDVRQFLTGHMLDHADAIPWPPADSAPFESHKQQMIAALFYACRYVRTPWWLRLDVDAAATGNRRWFSLRWFRSERVMVGPRYVPYKGPAMRWLDEWGDTLPEFQRFPPQPLDRKAGGWCTFHQTAWTRHCVAIAERHLGRCQIPLEAEDAFFTFCASRFRKSYDVVNMSRMGWLHPRKGRPFREMVEAAMRGEHEL